MRRLVVVVLFAACEFSGKPGGLGDDATPGECDTAASWADRAKPARDVYVSMNINGVPDGTPQHPYPTITAARQEITRGTRVVLAAGRYPGETLDDLRGTATAPIWIEGPPAPPRAELTGGPGIHLVKPQYVVLRHLDVASVTQSGINVDDNGERASSVAHHVLIDDVNVASSDVACFALTGVSDAMIRSSSGTSCRRGVILVGVHRAVISRVTLSTMTDVGFAAAGGSDDIELRQSVLSNPGVRSVWIGGDSSVDEFRPQLTATTDNYEASNVRVFDNVIEGGGGSQVGVLCSGCTASLVAHNLIRGGSFTHVFQLIMEHTTLSGFPFVSAGNVRYLANAIEVSGNPYGALGEAGTAPTSCTFAHNLWYKTDDAANSRPSLPETDGIYGSPSGYGNMSNEWRLCGGASIGTAAPLVEVPGTRDGTCRPAPPSIGPGEPDPAC